MKDISYYSDILGISLSDKQLEQFNTYMNMVIEKNKVVNLTAITDPEEFHLKHFADSLSLISAVNQASPIANEEVSVIDVGTGAGFPAIPLKIAFPNIHLTLLDSKNKRISFLNDVISELSLENVTTIHGRAEEGARTPELRDNFDFAVSRAVAKMNSLSEYCLPYVKPEGYFIAYKSDNISEELEEAKNAVFLLGAYPAEVVHFKLADSDIERSFVVIKKKTNTPNKYPRESGSIKKSPL